MRAIQFSGFDEKAVGAAVHRWLRAIRQGDEGEAGLMSQGSLIVL
jgi:hypothetical protein